MKQLHPTQLVASPAPNEKLKPAELEEEKVVEYQSAPPLKQESPSPTEKPLNSSSGPTISPLPVEKQIDLQSELPETEREIFKELLNQGLALKRSGRNTPPYSAAMGLQVIESLVGKSLARLAVLDIHSKKIFLFTGTPQTPGIPELAVGTGAYRGFSQRFMVLTSPERQALIWAVQRRFHCGQSNLRAILLLRHDIDAVVLAAQDNFAKSRNLDLENIQMTHGEFQMAMGVPFNFQIQGITTQKTE